MEFLFQLCTEFSIPQNETVREIGLANKKM